MSYDRRDNMSRNFGARADREHINYNGCKLDLSKKIEPEYDPFDDLYYFGSEYHKCWLCHEMGVETTMIKNNLNYWVHQECELQMHETLKYMQHE